MKNFTRHLTVCLFAVLLMFSGVFSSFAADSVFDDASVASIVESVVTEVVTYGNDELSSQIEMYESYGYPEIAEGFRSYQTLMPSLGAYQSIGTASYETGADGSTTIKAPVTFENGTVNFELSVSPEGYIASFTFTGESSNSGSLGSKMKEASINLVVGMGTVFLVLIFLCWIISLFKNISIIEKKLADRKAARLPEATADAPAANREILEFVPQTSGSDDEIQAVIAAAIAAYEAETGCSINKQPALSNGITIKTYRRN